MDIKDITKVNELEIFTNEFASRVNYNSPKSKNVKDKDFADLIKSSRRTNFFSNSSFNGKISIKVLNRIIPIDLDWSYSKEGYRAEPVNAEDKKFLEDVSFPFEYMDILKGEFAKEVIRLQEEHKDLILANREARYDQFWFNLYTKNKDWMKNYGFESFNPSLTKAQFRDRKDGFGGSEVPSVTIMKDEIEKTIYFDGSSNRPYNFSNRHSERKSYAKMDSLFEAVRDDINGTVEKVENEKKKTKEIANRSSEFAKFCKEEFGIAITSEKEWHSSNYGRRRYSSGNGWEEIVYKFELNKKNTSIKIAPLYKYKTDKEEENEQILDAAQVDIKGINMTVSQAKKFIKMMKEVDE